MLHAALCLILLGAAKPPFEPQNYEPPRFGRLASGKEAGSLRIGVPEKRIATVTATEPITRRVTVLRPDGTTEEQMALEFMPVTRQELRVVFSYFVCSKEHVDVYDRKWRPLSAKEVEAGLKDKPRSILLVERRKEQGTDKYAPAFDPHYLELFNDDVWIVIYSRSKAVPEDEASPLSPP